MLGNLMTVLMAAPPVPTPTPHNLGSTGPAGPQARPDADVMDRQTPPLPLATRREPHLPRGMRMARAFTSAKVLVGTSLLVTAGAAFGTNALAGEWGTPDKILVPLTTLATLGGTLFGSIWLHATTHSYTNRFGNVDMTQREFGVYGRTLLAAAAVMAGAVYFIQ